MRSLKFTPFEESLYVDDCPAYPWNILFRLNFQGMLRPAEWERAVKAVEARQPLLRAAVRRSRWGRFRWAWPADGAPHRGIVTHRNAHVPGTWPTLQRLSLEAGAGLDVWIADDGPNSEMLLHFHHVACDGIGAMQIIDDLLTAYDAACRGAELKLSATDARRLAQRGTYGYNAWKLLKNSRKLAVGLAGVRQFLMRKPVPLVEHRPVRRADDLPAAYPQLCAHEFPADETQALLAAARAAGATLNDLLVRDFFVTLLEWRRRRGAAAPEQWLRLMIPLDMRTPDDSNMPAANILSTMFLDRTTEQIEANSAALLQSVHDEVRLTKSNDLGMIYLLTLRLSAIIPSFMERVVERQNYCCTAVVSNLKRVLGAQRQNENSCAVVGNAVLERFEFFPPVRPLTCVSLGIATFGERLSVGLNSDPRFLTAADADELLQIYTSRLRESAGV